MPPLRSNDVQSFEKFADLVCIAVVKLQAEGRTGELQDGALHSLLVKKFADSQAKSYSRWLREHKQARSVLSSRDWLKEEVRIRVEAVEMAHGIAAEPAEVARASVKRVKRGGGSRTLFSTDNDQRREILGPTTKPPCVYCGGNHGVWSCRRFQSLGVDKRWDVVFAVWPVIMRGEIVPELVLVTLMAAGEIIITCCTTPYELIGKTRKQFLHGRGHHLECIQQHLSKKPYQRFIPFLPCLCG